MKWQCVSKWVWRKLSYRLDDEFDEFYFFLMFFSHNKETHTNLSESTRTEIKAIILKREEAEKSQHETILE